MIPLLRICASCWLFSAAFAAEPEVLYKEGVPQISSGAKSALIAVLPKAQVKGCLVTSTTRASADRAKEMYNFVEKSGLAAAKNLYGSEGDKVLDLYEALLKESAEKTAIVAAMEKKIIEVLPAARSKNQMMHVDRLDYDVFDVAESSIPPEKRADLVKAAIDSKAFHRFLGPHEGEKNCCHFEFRK